MVVTQSKRDYKFDTISFFGGLIVGILKDRFASEIHQIGEHFIVVNKALHNRFDSDVNSIIFNKEKLDLREFIF